MVRRQVTVTAGGPGSVEWTRDVAGLGLVAAGPGTVSSRPDWPSGPGPGAGLSHGDSLSHRGMEHGNVMVGGREAVGAGPGTVSCFGRATIGRVGLGPGIRSAEVNGQFFFVCNDVRGRFES